MIAFAVLVILSTAWISGVVIASYLLFDWLVEKNVDLRRHR